MQPYAASSNAIAIPVGIRGGIPNTKNLRIGAIKPTSRPYGHPHKKPHKSTGICMGHNAFPNCGICPVKKGNTIASARHTAA